MKADLEANRIVPSRPAAPGRRIVLHDYGTYPFTFELARYWADRGHPVRLIHSSDVDQVRVSEQSLGLPGIEVTRVTTEGDKYNFVSKPLADRRYGQRVARLLESRPCDVVVSGNTPLNAQHQIARAASKSGARFVYWMHDYISRGIGIALVKRMSKPIAAATSAWYRGLEHRLLREASAVVLASPQFRQVATDAGVARDSCFVIENWCPLGDLVPLDQDNQWAREQGLSGKRVLLYSGTLGLKHEPSCLLALARRLSHAKVVVVSQGPGAEWLRAEVAGGKVGNLLVLPFQPYRRLSEVLASATMLIAISDEAAASFSYPSKILTYLVAGRPILGIMPRDCYAASLIVPASSGIVVPPQELPQALDGLALLIEDRVQLAQMARNARQAAMARCNIQNVGPAFDRVLAFARTFE